MLWVRGGFAGEHIISFLPLVNKSCFGFVYQHCLMSKDAPDSVFVCVFVSARERRATAIGISADARKQQQHKKALEAKETAHVSEQDVLVGLALALCFVPSRGVIRSIFFLSSIKHKKKKGVKRYTSISFHGE